MAQTEQALGRLQARLPSVSFSVVPFSSPGDRDRDQDLCTSPPDFFTRDLDAAVLDGALDCAMHSAKDVPDPTHPELDWFWLPWRADPRDVLVLRPGERVEGLPPRPVIGVSSDRRSDYARRRFPDATCRPVRGTIEQRLAQLDAGDYDVLLMAAAALLRLGRDDRITEWIPREALPPPEGQGYLAVTYRLGDDRMTQLRSLFVKAVRFVSAGAGSAANLTIGGLHAIARADICLHDELMDHRVLAFLPAHARTVYVGKRCGRHRLDQAGISRMIADEARKGRLVVRVKGGDAGLYGRLAEETDALDALKLPYEVLPGVSSLVAATTGTGMLLTRRGISRGFTVLTPRGAGGTVEPFDAVARAALPTVFFMALRMADQVAARFLAEGHGADEPAAIVLDAGSDREHVIRTTLGRLADAAACAPDAAGLLVVGEICRYGRRERSGPMAGRRVLLTCSEALQERAADAVADYGGIPVRWPLVTLRLCDDAVDRLGRPDAYDWCVVTSPSAARCMLDAWRRVSCDLRRVPRLMVCGPGTAAILQAAGLEPDAAPCSDFGHAGAEQLAHSVLRPHDRVLRLRSRKAGPALSEAMTAAGAEVTDCILYENVPILYEQCPAFDVAFFASASAVETFFEQGFAPHLDGREVLVIGRPTEQALTAVGGTATVVGEPATVAGAMDSLAAYRVGVALAE